MNILSPIFARITKVDEQTRTVYGRATQEMVDRDGEVFDYATSKPMFQRWSASVYQDSAGKSLGNVRAMHGTTAAGVLKQIDFDDHEKAIDVAAKIVDDAEWKKVEEGVYTGFSIGGRYIKKWPEIMNGRMVNRYTADPSEISIVDRPCVSAAKFFTVHKMDGSEVQVPFKQPRVVLKTFSPPVSATSGLQGYDLEGSKKPAQKSDDSPAYDTTASRNKDPNADDALDTDPNRHCAEKREFSDKEREAAADSGAALPDGSYPIKTVQDLKNAVQAYGRAKNKAKAKAHIISRARALGATDQLPDNWKKADGTVILYSVTEMNTDALTKFVARYGTEAINKALTSTQEIEFSKGVYDVSALASIIAQLKSMADAQAYERKVEGDASPVPEKLSAAAASLLGLLSEMADEESNEITEGTTMEDVLRDTSPVVSSGLYRSDVSSLASALRKTFGIDVDGEDLAKRGARNSAKDLALIQKVHDAVCELGASCHAPSPHAHDGNSVGDMPPTQKTSQDDLGKQELTTMPELAKDAISAEGNKRGAAVSDPSLPPNSKNGENDDHTGGAAAGATKGKSRAAKDDDCAGPMKSKGRVSKDDDDDDDDDDARKSKSRVSKDDDDMDDDAKKSKSKKVAKDDDDDDDDARKFVMTEKGLADIVAKAVGAALAAANTGAQTVTIPRVAPKLMSVGKDGEVTKVSGADDLKKSVSAHPRDEGVSGENYKKEGDNGTCTLIKAIHARRVTLDQTDLRAIGVPLDANGNPMM